MIDLIKECTDKGLAWQFAGRLCVPTTIGMGDKECKFRPLRELVVDFKLLTGVAD